MILNGAQKPLAIPTIRVSIEVATIAAATTTRAVASTVSPPMLATTLCSGLHFICRTELLCAKTRTSRTAVLDR